MKKEAQNIDTPNLMDMLGKAPGGTAAPTSATNAPQGKGLMSFWPGGAGPSQHPAGHVQSVPDKMVGHMQQSLIDLHDDIQKTEALAAQTKQVEYKPEGEAKTVRDESGQQSTIQPERETGYKTFLSFLSEHAPSSAGREHSEYTEPKEGRKFPGATKPDQYYNRSDATQFDLKNFLQSISRVGKHVRGQEAKPDGIWGNMTQTALENTYAFAKTMLDFSEGMQIGNMVFNESDLKSFHGLILPAPTDNQEKSAKSKELMPIIQKVHQLFEFFNTKFLEKGGKGWGDYTSQQKAFIDYKKHEDVGKTGLDLYISRLDPNTVIGKVMSDTKGSGEITDVTVADLQSADNFKKFISEDRMTVDGHPVNLNNPDEVAMVFNYVKSILVAKPAAPQQVQAAKLGT